MKKTYNVYSTKMTPGSLKALSVSFIFALFFLGMSSNATAQLATSRADAGNAVNADYSITQKAEISVSNEEALQILEAELKDVRLEAEKQNLQPAEEAKNSAKLTFLITTIQQMTEKGSTLPHALYMGQSTMAMQVARYLPSIQLLVNSDGIVRGYVERLK